MTPHVVRLFDSRPNSVPGAAGTFMFDPTSGDVRGRLLFVLELRPDARLAILARYPQPGSR